jgi:hypothetical protein
LCDSISGLAKPAQLCLDLRGFDEVVVDVDTAGGDQDRLADRDTPRNGEAKYLKAHEHMLTVSRASEHGTYC